MSGRVHFADGFIAVDWGTTNRRAYLLDPNGQCVEEFEDSQGVLAIEPDRFAEAADAIRKRLGERPLLMGGMIGSSRGWIDAPYVPCPAGLEDIAGALVAAGETGLIVPGVSFLSEDDADVMRGEEVQLLGAVADGLIGPDCIVCHPGTHNKWVELKDGQISHFRTVMTGELFNLLREHSILSDLLQASAHADQSFRHGVRAGLDGAPIQSELFKVRARVLLGAARAGDASPYTSGLLIGTDLRIGLDGRDSDEIIVMGRPELTQLYASALSEAGRTAIEVDGERSFLAGIRNIAERLS